jgi:acyl CoA:acetate/3-ketoacid CoA transferase beta subunit
MYLQEIAMDCSLEEIRNYTDAHFEVVRELKTMFA